MPDVQFFSRNKRTIISLLIVVLSIVLGVSQDSLSELARRLDPPAIGYHHVTQIFDGDTIEVLLGDSREKIRFIGLDTPETNHPDKAVQCYGHAAKNRLTKLIGNQDVRLEADPTNTNRDRYKRLLRYVYLEDGTLLNQAMIKEGYGFAYVAFPFQKMPDFVTSQQYAKENQLGLWAKCTVEIDGQYMSTNPIGS